MAFPTPTVQSPLADYFKGTTTRILTFPTVASNTGGVAAPTAAEVTAGKDWTSQIMAISGFEQSTDALDYNLAGAGFSGTIPGRTKPGDCSIMFALSPTGPAADVRSAITPGLLLYVAFANEGFVTGMSFDLWPCRIGSYSPPQDLEAIGGVNVPFFPYAKPTLNVTIPTV